MGSGAPQVGRAPATPRPKAKPLDYDAQTTATGVKVFLWTFGSLEGFFILLALPYVGEKPFLGFGSAGGFVIVTFFSLGIAILVAFSYAGARFGQKVGDIVTAAHKRATHQKK